MKHKVLGKLVGNTGEASQLTMVVQDSFSVRRGEFIRVMHQERVDEGIVAVLGRVLLEAFAPGSVLIYLSTTGIFGGAAWWLLFTRPEMADPWWDLALFGGRVAGALLLIFVGWLLLLAAMGEWTARREMASLDREADLD